MVAAAVVAVAAVVGYYPAADTLLNCSRAELGIGSAAGIATAPDGSAVRVVNGSLQGAARVDPIVFAGGRGVTLCAGSLYRVDPPRYCTAERDRDWICPSQIDSGQCWTQGEQGVQQLDFRYHYAVTWQRCGDGCTVATTWSEPHWFDDVTAMAACVAILAIAVAAPRVRDRKELILNWVAAGATFAIAHERMPLQPLWSHGLLAAATAAAWKEGGGIEPSAMALIAASLPARSLGGGAVRAVRFVIGVGLCSLGGYQPTVQSALAAGWAVTATVWPVVTTAGAKAEEGWLIAAAVAVSAAVGGWASHYEPEGGGGR